MPAIRFEVLNTTIFGGMIPPFSGYFCKDTQKENNLRSENKKNIFVEKYLFLHKIENRYIIE